MENQKSKVVIKNHNGQIIDKIKTIKVIDQVRSFINQESRVNYLKYEAKGDDILVLKDDLIILKVKLPTIGYYLVE